MYIWRERNINVWLPLAHPLLGTWPATQACALTGNPTSEPLVRSSALNTLSHTSQGKATIFIWSHFFSLRFCLYALKPHIAVTGHLHLMLKRNLWNLHIFFRCLKAEHYRDTNDDICTDVKASLPAKGNWILRSLLRSYMTASIIQENS